MQLTIVAAMFLYAVASAPTGERLKRIQSYYASKDSYIRHGDEEYDSASPQERIEYTSKLDSCLIGRANIDQCNRLANSALSTYGIKITGNALTKIEIDNSLILREVQYVPDGIFEQTTVFWAFAYLNDSLFIPKSRRNDFDHLAISFEDDQFIASDVREQCLTLSTEELSRRSASIRSYLSDSTKNALDEILMMRAIQCASIIKIMCENVRFIEGVPVLAYKTVGGDIRDVTIDDVQNDIEEQSQIGITRAKQLEHLELSRVLSVCSESRSNGYEWTYKRPSVKKRKTSRSSSVKRK